MIIVLIVIIVLLIATIIYLNVLFYKEKKVFQAKLVTLQNIIVELGKKQVGQSEQIKLSEGLEKTLKKGNAILSDDIFGLNYELFTILSKNNLLKK